MVFKINISDKGKTLKLEVENEEIIDKLIGDKIEGKEISPDLEGYELEITGTSDKAGFPGLKQFKGPQLKRALLRRGKGMWENREGLIKRKTVRGNAISADTVQINIKVIKEGKKKFEELLPKKENPEAEQKA